MIAKSVRISGKGQISIPVDIREAVGLEKGDDLLLIQKDDRIIIEKTAVLLKDKFDDLIKQSEKVAKKLWDNRYDEVWNGV